jgi:pimeloyl-ACP methyl ester carboxylesterase
MFKRILLLWAAAAAAFIYAQQYTPGPQVLTFFSEIDDSDQPYGLYLPRNIDPKAKYPLVISLHGAWSNHRLNLRRVFGFGNRLGETDAEATRYWPKLKDIGYIIATPLARGTMGYQGIPEKDVYAVLEDVKRRFPIDEDRVYLTGLSMGGGGTLWLGLTRPDIWAAIAPVCPAPPAEAADLAPNALHLPVKLFHGAIDPVVKAEVSRQWLENLQRAGVAAEYVEYPGVRHNAWDYAYKDGAIFDWFSRFRRVRYPERVRYSTRHYKYPSAYWVRFDKLIPGNLASIDAMVASKNRLVISTSHLDAFTLDLRKHPMVSPKMRVSLTIDGMKLTAKPAGPISLSRTGKGWILKHTSPDDSMKRPGAEGPITAGLSGRHVYVYGTADSPSPKETQRRRDEAAYAAEWSTRRSRLLLTFRVVSDVDAEENDFRSANLFLFGTDRTNLIIAKYKDRMPLRLNPGAADYGLLYVYPVDGRYIIVNSGLAWWTRSDIAVKQGYPFVPFQYQTLDQFGDYVFFKGGLDHVIATGRFDNRWTLVGDARKAMLETGAVEIR